LETGFSEAYRNVYSPEGFSAFTQLSPFLTASVFIFHPSLDCCQTILILLFVNESSFGCCAHRIDVAEKIDINNLRSNGD